MPALVASKTISTFFRRSSRGLVVAVIALAFVFGYGIVRINETAEGDEIKISVIQGNIPQEVKWDPAASEDIIKKGWLENNIVKLSDSKDDGRFIK